MELRRATRDAVGPDGAVVVGRGYEAVDDAGSPPPGERLHPGAFEGLAIVDVAPRSPEERQALRTARFGVGRPVLLRVEGGDVGVHDEAGEIRGGTVEPEVAAATRQLLEGEGRLATWVAWEWLREDGRTAIRVALTRETLAPQRLTAPPQGRGAQLRASLRDRRLWIGLAAVIVVIALAFGACS